MPRIPLIYTIGANFLRKKWFPVIIADSYFKILKETKFNRKRAFKIFDKILNNCILLNLNLTENVDFKYDDKDEIKSQQYKKKHLELMGYSKKYSNLDAVEMDRWNMHTISNHIIENNKIKLCVLKNNHKLKYIFEYCIKNTKIDLKDICPVLYDYICYKNYDFK